MRCLNTPSRDPKEIVGPEIVDLVKEQVEPAKEILARYIETLPLMYAVTHEFSFSSTSNIRL